MPARGATSRSRPVERVRAMHPRRTTRHLVDSFSDHDLLTYATAIAFGAFFALIPLLLTGLGLLGAFDLTSVWSRDVAPHLRGQVSQPVFAVIDQTVRRVLGQESLFWATLGALLAVWAVSGAMRAVMNVLDRIYEVRRRRSFKERYAVSIGLSTLLIVLLLGAGAVMILGHAVGWLGSLVRWPVAAALLLAAVVSVVRWAPAEQREWHWVSFGTAIVVIGWLGMSAVFSLYLREFADYGSIYGNLATIIIALEYLHLSAVVFLGGLALDGIAQTERGGIDSPPGG
jgi:membrane protein